MDAIQFDEVNLILAKDQPQYNQLPVFFDKERPEQPVYCCFELTPEELAELNRTGKFWYGQWTFGNSFHPMRISTTKPF